MNSRCELVIIGGSAGSLDVILNVLPDLRPNLPFAIVVVLHRKGSLNSTLTDVLANKTKIPVTEVEEKEPVLPSRIYIAPPDYHLLFESNRTFSLDSSEKINYSRPSIDISFESAADIYKNAAVGLLLSGANTDGTEGLLSIKRFDGITAIQDPADARVPLMPETALKSMKIDKVLKDREIAGFINGLAS
jgi:two-component system, chemotaxis family, protein-glutamate methylesterase/glutaminase